MDWGQNEAPGCHHGSKVLNMPLKEPREDITTSIKLRKSTTQSTGDTSRRGGAVNCSLLEKLNSKRGGCMEWGEP